MHGIRLAPLVVVFTAVSISSGAQDSTKLANDSYETLIDRIRPSVIQLGRENPQPPRAVSGSAFMVYSGGYAITALHVLRIIRDDINDALAKHQVQLEERAFIPVPTTGRRDRPEFSPRRYKVVDREPNLDLALIQLELERSDSLPSVELELSRPRDGLSIAMSGFPLGNLDLVTTRGYIASGWYDLSFIAKQPLWGYLGDLTIVNGFSGGPVYSLATGRVLGVALSAKRDRLANSPYQANVSLGGILPAAHIQAMLAKHIKR